MSRSSRSSSGCPRRWDDTEAINGSIGDYVTVARRSGREWFVGSMTDEQPRALAVPLRFLDRDRRYLATIYGDAPDTDLETNPDAVEITRRVVDRSDRLIVRMAGGGDRPSTCSRSADRGASP